MWNQFFLITLSLLIATLVLFVVVERTRYDQKTTVLVEDLLTGSSTAGSDTFTTADLDELPDPVQRYLNNVLTIGQNHVASVRIEQRGTFRSGGPTSGWRPFTATQHVTTSPPGFVWDAAIEMVPRVPVRVLDTYHDGRGTLSAKLGGVLTVMNAEPGPDLDEGELLRYLGETPLYPTALLPGSGVQWSPVDDHAAEATLHDGSTTATLTFHFNDRDEVERVTGLRGFTSPDGTIESRPWIGYWRKYENRAGMRVPTVGDVAWVYPEAGEVSYWKGQMEELSYNTGKSGME